MPHLHLSLQSGDDMILKRMKRRHLRADADPLLRRGAPAAARHRLRRRPDRRLPDRDGRDVRRLAAISSTTAASPSCTSFPFSPRQGTPAARMPQVDRADRQGARGAAARQAGQQRSPAPSRRADRRATSSVLVEKRGIGSRRGFRRGTRLLPADERWRMSSSRARRAATMASRLWTARWHRERRRPKRRGACSAACSAAVASRTCAEPATAHAAVVEVARRAEAPHEPIRERRRLSPRTGTPPGTKAGLVPAAQGRA